MFGLALGTAELGVKARQFFRALPYPPLQGLIGAFELLRRFDARRDVGEGRDDASVRHRVRAHLHDQIAFGETLQKWLAAGDVTRKPFAHEHIGCVAVGGAVFGVEAQKVIQRGANAGKLRRQCEDLAELAIPAHQVQVLVEYGNALSHMVERGLQDLAIVVDRSVGIVQELESCLGRDCTLAQQQREHET